MSSMNFRKSIFNLYFWRLVSLCTGFLSFLIVIPKLSSNQELYGIYAFCSAFNLYFTYADIGFLSSGQKFAAEEYAKGDRASEIKYLGFTGFILLCMVIPFSIFVILLSFWPENVISNLSKHNAGVVSHMLFILGVFSPFQILFQRITQSILTIRIKDFISLRIDILTNLIKILSVFYFFSGASYSIIEYFLFINVLTILGSVVTILLISLSENYDFILFAKAIKFDKSIYLKTKKLAFASFFMTLGWILYFESDLFFIGKLFGPKEVAIYSVSFTLFNFLRIIWSIIYGPFSQRFNHLVGSNSSSQLRRLMINLINFTFPICVLSVIILLISAKYIIISWVGTSYSDSIVIFQILLLTTLFNFVLQPVGYYFIAITNYRYLNLNAISLPVVFMFSLIILVPSMGILGFAIAKVLAIAAGAIISFWGVRKFVNLIRILKEWYLILILNSLILYVGLNYVYSLAFDVDYKWNSDILMLILILFFTILIVFIIALLFHKSLRNYISNRIRNIKKKQLYMKVHSFADHN